ncbi:thioredoxin family protein [Vibrio navarrensis]|uniref:Thioredoxin family protein n=1 Tax=Vibrio navarrensis TaxID=29495 RepID=A0AAJ4IEW5_9VIBR|nr:MULTISPECIES: thioredoxin family protein [Vibrio]EGR2797502.1 thioredoxin family protein [Vibrio navarrensis]EHA1123558.1 thioredoxin family protein [Vibrio navarrensis]EJL6393676.1 thioredoxin family protein [Vibrio navarrensis]EKA5634542.1 thioredoxin family protein [Vibrio navarrensis]KJR30686.1 thioredoxin [Vibrio sp. S234-5]
MTIKATFYHAGCPVCVTAEEQLASALDPKQFDVEVVHFGKESGRISEAERLGVKSVPALVIDGNVFHINYGASLEQVKNG